MSKYKKNKYCPKCDTVKEVSLFSKSKDRKDGLYYCCRECRKNIRQSPLRKKKRQQYYQNNKEQILKNVKDRYSNKREEVLEYHKKYYIKNSDKIKKRVKSHRASTRGRQLRSIRHRERVQTDINYKLRTNLRKRIIRALSINQKSGSAVTDLGCTVEEFKAYIEALWEPGMRWENWSREGWHLDHIKPLDSFDLSNREEFLKACHYTNYQPLWAKDNLKKSNKKGWSKR